MRGAGTLAFRQGDNDVAEALFTEGLSLATELDEQQLRVFGYADLARVALRRGDYATVRARSEEGRALAEAAGDRAAERMPVHMLAAAARMEGDLTRAREYYVQSIEISRELGLQRNVAGELHNLGYLELHGGDLEAAGRLFRECLDWAWEHRDMYILPYSLVDFGVVAAAEGELVRAARLLGAGEGLFEAAGAVPDPDDRVEFDEAVANVREALDDASFADAWERGRGLSLEDAVAYATDRPRDQTFGGGKTRGPAL